MQLMSMVTAQPNYQLFSGQSFQRWPLSYAKMWKYSFWSGNHSIKCSPFLGNWDSSCICDDRPSSKTSLILLDHFFVLFCFSWFHVWFLVKYRPLYFSKMSVCKVLLKYIAVLFKYLNICRQSIPLDKL